MLFYKIQPSFTKIFTLGFLLIVSTPIHSMDQDRNDLNLKKHHIFHNVNLKKGVLAKKEEPKKSQTLRYKRFENLIISGLIGGSLGTIASSRIMTAYIMVEINNFSNIESTKRALIRSFDCSNQIERCGIKVLIGCLLYKISISIVDNFVQKKLYKNKNDSKSE